MSTRRDLANALRFLSIDAVQKANSGHPGMPMGMADIAEVLWRGEMAFNPTNPKWSNRDRFVLSNGHGSVLIYSLLHLTGFDVSLDDLKEFRQLNSKTPGHPEYGDTPGIETTTGPLGQGLAMAVGMAITERHLASRFNRNSYEIVNHYTYVFAGDGCLMEGISHEACSLAGTLGLGKLIVFYDDNGISIDGSVEGWFTEDIPNRFKAYHWEVISDVDGHDAKALSKALASAKSDKQHPTLICCKTQIGFGSPNKANTATLHGTPLGNEEIALTREYLGWSYDCFEVPPKIREAWDQRERGKTLESRWNKQFAQYEIAHPDLASEFLRRQSCYLSKNWESVSQQFIAKANQETKPLATRKASFSCLQAFKPLLPELVGGSADLTGSNCTATSDSHVITQKDFSGNYLEYGVREFGMAAIMNGMALHGGVIPYGGTFLVFSDYARNAIRLSALMRQRVIYVFTHDSIGLGEDGPTHQPVEHASSLRLIPGLNVWRPCDLAETAVAWQQALEYVSPSALLLSRQDLPQQVRSNDALRKIVFGAYVLWDPGDFPQGIFIATGSEVPLAVSAAESFAEEGVAIRVVSIPCCERFLEQDAKYRELVLPSSVKARVAVEAGVSAYWYQFVGELGAIVGLDQYGKSAPSEAVFTDLGFTVTHVKQAMQKLLNQKQVCSIE